MKPKTVIILAGILVLLCIFAVIYRSCLSKPSPMLVFSKLDSEKINKFEIIRNDDMLVFEKLNDRWQITKPISFEASKNYINDFITSIEGISLKNVISTNKDKYPKFKVDDSSGTLINVYGSKTKSPVSFYAGKSSALNPGHIYLRLRDSKEVYVSRGPKDSILKRKAADWRNKIIIALNSDDVAEINLVYPNETVKLFKKKEKWVLNDPESPDEAKQAECDKILDKLNSLSASEIILPEEAEKIKEKTGFGKSEFQLVAKTFGGEEYKLIIGNMKESGHYYIKKEKSDIVYTINKYNISSVMKHARDFTKAPDQPDKPEKE